MADSRQRLLRTLDRIDASIHALGWDSHVPAAHRPASLDVPPYVGERELEGSGISTVLWATGYRSHMPFLPSWARTRASREQPGREVEPLQSGGIGASPGLYFLGLNFMRHRYSSTIGGVQEDARYLSHVILEHFERRYARAS
jgi:putative flavoprotein involved in K+ transport